MAIVNGFDTQKLRYILFENRDYEIYKAHDLYYLTNGYILVKCDFDVIEKTLANLPELKIPNNGYGYKFNEENGWSDSSISMLQKYLEWADNGHYTYGENGFHTVKEFKQIHYQENKYGCLHIYPCIICELDNGEKVLLNKKYAEILSKAKKWGWFAECRDRLSCVHFMNKQNISEAWIFPIRYKDGAI